MPKSSSRLSAALLLLAAEVMVAPLLGLRLSHYGNRCRTMCETLACVAGFYGVKHQARELGFNMPLRARLATWRFAVRKLRPFWPRAAAGTAGIVALLLALLARGGRSGPACAALWCLASGGFFASCLLGLPVDKEVMRAGASGAFAIGALSLVGLALDAGAILFLLPLSVEQRRVGAKCIGIFALVCFVYNANIRQLGAGDTAAAPYVAVSLVRDGDFDLDEFKWARGEFATIDPVSYGMAHVGGHLVTKYPPMSSVLAAPLFAMFFFVPWMGVPDNEFLMWEVGKLAGTIFAALSVVGVYLAVRAARPRWALIVACLYAFGTCTWFVSQALWQHPACEMSLALALCCLIGAERDKRWLAGAGLALALAVATRYASAAQVAVLGGYALWRHRAAWWRLVLGALPVVVFQCGYNWFYFGAPWTPSYRGEALSGWRTPLATGLVGHLIGPSRGLLVYSPFLAFALVGAWQAWRRRCDDRLAALACCAAAAACVHVVVLSKWSPWHGGLSYGYRMIVEVCPLAAFVLAFGLGAIWRRPAVRCAFVLAALLSVLVQLIGILGFDGRWERTMAGRPDQHSSIRDCQIAFYVRHNRWYSARLTYVPYMAIEQQGLRITRNGLVQDPDPSYPRAYMLERIGHRPRKP